MLKAKNNLTFTFELPLLQSSGALSTILYFSLFLPTSALLISVGFSKLRTTAQNWLRLFLKSFDSTFSLRVRSM